MKETTDDSVNGALSMAEARSFAKDMDVYVKHLYSLASVFPHISQLIAGKFLESEDEYKKFINTKTKSAPKGDEEKGDGEDVGKKGTGEKISMALGDYNEFSILAEEVETSLIAYKIIPVNFVVSFVGQYDAYLSNLIRTLFLMKPEILNSSEKNIQFSDLIGFEKIDDAKEYIVEKEVESILRESHLKQIKWLEQKVGLKLREDLPSFNDFIEITERRNLFVHTNGIISQQYLQTCEELKIEGFEKLKRGEKLHASTEYVYKSFWTLFEIGIKLGHVLWRKIQPQDLKEADIHLSGLCYDLLVSRRYRLALTMLKFATETLKKHCDQETKLVFAINKALAYYLLEDKENCKRELDKVDWSATSDKFKLALSVLNEDYTSAVAHMRIIGDKNDHIDQTAYRDWPLFKKFRKTKEFQTAYNEIFSKEFVIVDRKKKSLDNIVQYIKKRNDEAAAKRKAETSQTG